MGWLMILFASVGEFVGVVGLSKFSQQKTVGRGIAYGGGFGISFMFLYMAFQYLPVSITYAVWTGIGTAGAVLINMLFFGESKSAGRIISVLLIIIGVVGLRALS